MFLDFSIFTPTYISLTWAFILVLSSRGNRARIFLGIFMLAVAMVFLSHVVYFHRLKDIYLYFDLLFVFGSLSIFPTYYWYIKLLTVKSQFDYRELKHLIPAFFMLICVSITYLLMPDELRKTYVYIYLYGIGKMSNAPLLIKVQVVFTYVLQILYFLQIVFSYIKIRKYMAEYNHKISNFYSNLENKTLEWPKIILYSFSVSSVFTIITNFLGRSYFDKSPAVLFVTCITYGALIFVLGYLGYLQNHTVKDLELDAEVEPTTQIETPTKKKTKRELQNLFEKDQVFKNSELKIIDIALRLNTNRTYISNFINQEYGCSFSTLVNQYRIEAAKTLLRCPKNKNFSLEHISSQVGFGSLHSFIRVFKEMEDTTPGKYREEAICNENELYSAG